MTDTITASLGQQVHEIGYEFDTRTDHCIVVGREWSPDNEYRKGFYWYTFTRTPLEVIPVWKIEQHSFYRTYLVNEYHGDRKVHTRFESLNLDRAAGVKEFLEQENADRLS